MKWRETYWVLVTCCVPFHDETSDDPVNHQLQEELHQDQILHAETHFPIEEQTDKRN